MLFVCIVFKIVIAPPEHLDTFPHFCVLIFDWSSGQGRGSALGRIRGGGGGRGFGRGRGRGRGRSEKISAEDLDAELEKYHTEAMQIN